MRFINHDIKEVVIPGKANYLAALGLSAYTEILGGLYNGNLSSNLRNNYIKFIETYFPVYYKRIDDSLKNDGKKGLYNMVRNGLTHEYFIKRTSVIVEDSSPRNCGIIYQPNNSPEIIFCVKQYLQDLMTAFGKYYFEIFDREDPDLIEKFQDALQSIGSSIVGGRKSIKTFTHDISGTNAMYYSAYINPQYSCAPSQPDFGKLKGFKFG